MIAQTSKLYTVEEWLAMPVERPYTELVDGAIQPMTASIPNPSRIIFNIRTALCIFKPELISRIDGEINVIVDGVTGRNGWIPDLAFAYPENPLRIADNWYGVPDWVLEVWAGDERRPDRVQEKRLRWQRAGVAEFWEVILEDQQIINTYRLDANGVYQVMPQADPICSEIIAGFCIARAAIFANLVEG